MKFVILVTGAGSGIGRLSAQSLALAGHTVYATMRGIEGRNSDRAEALRDWARSHGADLRPLELDVLSQASADAAAAAVMAEQGRIDVVMQNAGHLVIGPTEAPLHARGNDAGVRHQLPGRTARQPRRVAAYA